MPNSKQQKRTRFWRWLAASALGTAFFLTPETVMGQLRTGQTQRELYRAPAKKVTSTNTGTNTNTGTGSAKKSLAQEQVEREVSSLIAQGPVLPENADSPVVTASCTTCNQQPNLLPGESITPVWESEGEYYSDPMDVGCDSCGTYAPCGHDGCGELGCRLGGGLFHRLLSGVYVRAEAIQWDRSAQTFPTLANNGTNAIFGGSVNDSIEGGGRLTVGTWLDPCQHHGLVFKFWDAGAATTRFATTSTQTPNIRRPFLNPDLTANFFRVAEAGQATGSINIEVDSEVTGGELTVRRWLCASDVHRWDALIGYQTMQLDESLDIRTSTTGLIGNTVGLPAGVQFDLRDFFQTRNEFHGMNLGIQGVKRHGCWYFEGLFKLGIGSLSRTINISGDSTIAANEGLFARPSNMGNYKSDTFVVLPEVGLTMGYRITRNLDFIAGYSYVGLPKVVQVSSTLDRQLVVDDALGATRPRFDLTERNFSLSGINLGLQWRY